MKTNELNKVMNKMRENGAEVLHGLVDSHEKGFMSMIRFANEGAYTFNTTHFECIYLFEVYSYETNSKGYIAHSYEVGNWSVGTNKAKVIVNLKGTDIKFEKTGDILYELKGLEDFTSKPYIMKMAEGGYVALDAEELEIEYVWTLKEAKEVIINHIKSKEATNQTWKY